MAATLNQIIKTQIASLARSHAQINSVYYGNIGDWFAREAAIKYGAFFFVFSGGSTANKKKSLTLNMWCIDRILPNYANLADVHSDQLQVMEDIVGKLRDQNSLAVAGDNFSFQLFIDSGAGTTAPDETAGVSGSVTLDLPYGFDCNRMPLRADQIFDTPFDIQFE